MVVALQSIQLGSISGQAMHMVMLAQPQLAAIGSGSRNSGDLVASPGQAIPLEHLQLSE
jgi:hypothetical protein